MDYSYKFISANPEAKTAVMAVKAGGKSGLLMSIFNLNEPRRQTFSVIALDEVFKESVRSIHANPFNSLTARSNVAEIQKAYSAMGLPAFLSNPKTIPQDDFSFGMRS